MEEFDFMIVVEGVDTSTNFEEVFYDAGCDDATISLVDGHVLVDFTRKSHSRQHAIESAIRDVESTGATVVRIDEDPSKTFES